VNFRGFDYEMNIAVCRRALVQCQVDGELDTMDGLADAIGRSRSTASRFFSGRQMSLTVALAVLAKLKLRFEEVFTPCGPDQGAPTSIERAV
jgi:hypothetical protein